MSILGLLIPIAFRSSYRLSMISSNYPESSYPASMNFLWNPNSSATASVSACRSSKYWKFLIGQRKQIASELLWALCEKLVDPSKYCLFQYLRSWKLWRFLSCWRSRIHFICHCINSQILQWKAGTTTLVLTCRGICRSIVLLSPQKEIDLLLSRIRFIPCLLYAFDPRRILPNGCSSLLRQYQWTLASVFTRFYVYLNL